MFFCQTFCSKKFSTAPLTLGFSQLISVGPKSSVTNSGVKRVIFETCTFFLPKGSTKNTKIQKYTIFIILNRLFLSEHSPISMAFFYPILVRSTPLRTICRITCVKSRLPRKVAQKMRRPPSHLLRLFAWYVRFQSLNASNSLQGDRFVLKSDCREQILQNL